MSKPFFAMARQHGVSEHRQANIREDSRDPRTWRAVPESVTKAKFLGTMPVIELPSKEDKDDFAAGLEQIADNGLSPATPAFDGAATIKAPPMRAEQSFESGDALLEECF